MHTLLPLINKHQRLMIIKLKNVTKRRTMKRVRTKEISDLVELNEATVIIT